MSDPKNPEDRKDRTLVDPDGEMVQALIDEVDEEEEEATRAMEIRFDEDEAEEAAEAPAPPPMPPPKRAPAPPPRRPAPPVVEDDDDDEEPEERTLMLDVSGGIEALGLGIPRARLRIIFGNDRGSIHELQSGMHDVGRHESCAVVLNDPAVSRRHFSLDVSESAVKVIDSGSGNGTKVNGKLVDRLELEHGARLEVGTTVMRYEDPTKQAEGVPFAGEGAAAPAQSPVPMVVMGLVVLIAVLGLVGSQTNWFGLVEPPVSLEEQTNLIEEKVAKGIEENRKVEAKQDLSMAQRAFTNRDWQNAQIAAKSALDKDEALTEAKDLIVRAKAEARVMAFVKSARELQKNQRPLTKDLQDNLSSIPQDSAYYAEAQTLLVIGEGPSQVQIITALRGSLKANDLEGAQLLLEQLETRFPESEALEGFQEDVAQLKRRKAARRRAAMNAKPRPVVRREAPAPAPKKKSPKGKNPLAKGYDLYRMGDFDGATSFFKGVASSGSVEAGVAEEADKAARAVGKFQNRLQAGKAALKRYRGGEAVTALGQAQRADRTLGGYQARLVEPELADAHQVQAKQAFLNKQYGSAMSHVRKVMALDPSNGEARALHKKLQSKAAAMFEEAMEARNAGNEERARRRLQDVLGIADETSAIYDKARRAINNQ